MFSFFYDLPLNFAAKLLSVFSSKLDRHATDGESQAASRQPWLCRMSCVNVHLIDCAWYMVHIPCTILSNLAWRKERYEVKEEGFDGVRGEIVKHKEEKVKKGKKKKMKMEKKKK